MICENSDSLAVHVGQAGDALQGEEFLGRQGLGVAQRGQIGLHLDAVAARFLQFEVELLEVVGGDVLFVLQRDGAVFFAVFLERLLGLGEPLLELRRLRAQ